MTASGLQSRTCWTPASIRLFTTFGSQISTPTSSARGSGNLASGQHNSYIEMAVKWAKTNAQGLIQHIDPQTNKLAWAKQSELAGDHVLPRKR